jgi:hypothetical protein
MTINLGRTRRHANNGGDPVARAAAALAKRNPQAVAEPLCECGHVRDEHGSACAVDGCPCVQFDPAEGEGGEDG